MMNKKNDEFFLTIVLSASNLAIINTNSSFNSGSKLNIEKNMNKSR